MHTTVVAIMRFAAAPRRISTVVLLFSFIGNSSKIFVALTLVSKMSPLKNLVGLSFHYLALVRAISIPSPLQVLSANDTIPTIIIPSG